MICALKKSLSDCFLKNYGAPSMQHASKAADDEVNLMLDLCSAHDKGSLISISREVTKDGIKENFEIYLKQNLVLNKISGRLKRKN